ncbi:hypothetical protein Tco_0466837, partial [Tanacetum coccineum]
GLLDHYGYNDIKEYLSWNYFPSTDKENKAKDITDKDITYKDITDKDITNKDITDEDCIHESNYAMYKSKCYYMDEIVNKIGVRKSEICADKAKEKRKVSYRS